VFEDSPVTKDLFRFATEKFGQVVSPIFLAKCCATVSCKLGRPTFSVTNVGQTRSMKTYTSEEVMDTFDSSFYIDIRSDFTMHALLRYKSLLPKGRCIFINDANTQFESKSNRAKDRLVSGLSELLGDGIYSYEDFGRRFSLQGKVTLIMNMVPEVYLNYKDRLFGLTFSERFLTLHHYLTEQEKKDWVRKEERVKKMHYKHLITEDDIETDVRIPSKYMEVISLLAQRFSYKTLRTFVGCQDIIKAGLRAHASLNKRTDACRDDFDLIRMLEDYLVNPHSPYEGRIVELRSRGYSIRDICKILNKPNYVRQVQTVIKKAELRGILPLEDNSINRGSIRKNSLPLRKSSIRLSDSHAEESIVDSRNGRLLMNNARRG